MPRTSNGVKRILLRNRLKNSVGIDSRSQAGHTNRADATAGFVAKGETMRRLLLWSGLAGVCSVGCASLAPLDNPITVKSNPDVENPVLVAPGEPDAGTYAEVYEHVIDVLDDYFELKPTSRYSGHIETVPRIAPGYEQPWRSGNPDRHERLLATLQTIRKFAIVDIWAGERGGYKIYIEVRKELIDQDRPSQATAGNAVFRESPTVNRQFDVVGTDSSPVLGPNERPWVPVGRDFAMEQLLLARFRECGASR